MPDGSIPRCVRARAAFLQRSKDRLIFRSWNQSKRLKRRKKRKRFRLKKLRKPIKLRRMRKGRLLKKRRKKRVLSKRRKKSKMMFL